MAMGCIANRQEEVPFVWGPVGGGESSPKVYTRSFSRKGRIYEAVRDLARNIGALDPFVKRSAKKASVALATTRETESALVGLGAKTVDLLGNVALNAEEMAHYGSMKSPPENPFRFVSMGRLLNWKGFHMGLESFAKADLADAEFWFVGTGPFENRLKSLAKELEIENKVVFHGQVTRDRTYELLESSHCLVHPSLHDSGGWVCIEAMASGRPVICLDLGGPAVVVDQESGFVANANSPAESVEEMARFMHEMYHDRALWLNKSKSSKERARSQFTWEAKASQISKNYQLALNQVRNTRR